MISIGDLLGHPGLISSIDGALSKSKTGIVRLTGPAGSGKSTIAIEVGRDWAKAGGTVIVATGDDQQAGRAYYPFLLGLVRAGTDWGKLATQGSRSAAKVLDAAKVTGGFASGLFDLVETAAKQYADRAVRTLSPIEREILADIRRQARGKKILVIADNFHWWDKGSIDLLEQLRSQFLLQHIAVLKELKILLVDTVGQRVAEQEACDRVCRSASDMFSSSLCESGQFRDLLAAFGVAEALPDELISSMYSLTGGHLKVTQQLAEYLAENGPAEIGNDAVNSDRLLAMRLRSLGEDVSAIEDCLRMASIIGLSFDHRELACATDTSVAKLRTILSQAEKLRFIEDSKSAPRFSHDLLRAFFLRGQSGDAVSDARRRLQACIAKLRPGDYELRAKLLIGSDDLSLGRDLFALAAAQWLRDGGSLLELVTNAQEVFPQDGALVAWIQVIATAYEAIASGNHARGYSAVSSGPFDRESLLMAAERQYVAAICSMELQTQEGFEASQRALETWIPRTQGETELNLRMRLLLQQVHVLAGNVDQARQIEALLEPDLLEREGYDAGALELLQTQNRRAASVYVPEVAVLRIERAAQYYGASDNGSARRMRGYYRALNNQVGVLIQLGRYDAAFSAARQAEALIVQEEDVDFPRRDVFCHNLVLASVRNGKISLDRACEYQLRIIRSPDGKGDNFLQRCNLVAYQLLSKRMVEADFLLNQLEDEAERGHFSETYLLYYLRSLRVAYHLLTQNLFQARHTHEELAPLVASLRWTTAPYIRRRHQLWAKMLEDENLDLRQSNLDTLVIATNSLEIGPCWDHNARLVPCVELAFWSDS